LYLHLYYLQCIFMIKCNYDVIDLSIFIVYDVQYVASVYGSKINWIFVFSNHKWATRILNALVLNALVFMFLGVPFKNCAILLIYFSNLIYMYFHQGLKNLDIQKLIYHHFFFKNLKNEIFFLLVFGSIVVKTDNLHLFEKVINFLFHA